MNERLHARILVVEVGAFGDVGGEEAEGGGRELLPASSGVAAEKDACCRGIADAGAAVRGGECGAEAKGTTYDDVACDIRIPRRGCTAVHGEAALLAAVADGGGGIEAQSGRRRIVRERPGEVGIVGACRRSRDDE